MFASAVVFTAISVAALVWAEVNGPTGHRLLKMLASSGFIWVAVSVGPFGNAYGRAVIAALVLSWIGDLLLTFPARAAFVGGLVSFLLGHVAYSIAFGILGVNPAVAAIVALGLAVVAWLLWRWLAPHVGDMRGPVVAYVVVITIMVVAAVGAFGAGATALLPIGASLFYASDIAVARNRFVAPGPVNRLVGLPLYYLAQVLLASTAGC